MLDYLGFVETGLKFDFHDTADHFCDMFWIKKIYLPTLRPIIADSYWAINSLFSTSFAIIADETQIFHPPWYFPQSFFLLLVFGSRGHFTQWKIIGEKSAGTNRSNFSSLDEIYHENVTKFQLSPLSLFLEGRKGNLPHFTLKIFWRGPTFQYQYRHLKYIMASLKEKIIGWGGETGLG